MALLESLNKATLIGLSRCFPGTSRKFQTCFTLQKDPDEQHRKFQQTKNLRKNIQNYSRMDKTTREWTENEQIKYEPCKSEHNISDSLSKLTARIIHYIHHDIMMERQQPDYVRTSPLLETKTLN